MSSIYNIEEYKTGREYKKNDIVYKTSNIGSSGVPKVIHYYYALKTFTTQAPPTTPPFTNQYWGGYTNDHEGQQIPHFIWTASYNLSTNHNPRVNTISFGNGYEQKNPDGLFTGLIKLSVTFDMRTEKEATAILQFLKARRGTESFIIQNLPPVYADGSYKKRFICPNFSSNFSFHDNYTIKATFNETNSTN